MRAYRGDGGQEVDHLGGMIALCVEEVETVFGLADVDGIAVGVVFKDQLLEVEEGAFVGDLLADLHTRTPGVCGVRFRAVGALVVGYDVLDLEALLENCAFERLHILSLRAKGGRGNPLPS